MSLQQAAKYLQSKGRGDDTVLVHMTPKEVKSLQAVAMAHGGSLSINPETGLPEAGFLSSILPTVIGASLMAATGGAAAPAVFGLSMPTAIGLGVGALQTARTGSLGKGLMAGLGAYGGAGLAGGLMASGAQQMAGDTIAKQAAENAALEGITLPENYAQLAGQTSLPQEQALARMGTSNLDLMGKGLTGGFGGFQSGMTAAGGPSLGKAAFAVAAPVLAGMEPQGLPPIQRGGPNPYNYSYSANTTTPFPQPDVPDVAGLGQAFGRENRFFTPTYTRMAGGGTVEMMSDANAVGANTGYPMADISRGAYATPYQQPISQNVVTGPQDTRVDPYTGAERLAGGGLSHLGDYSDGGRLLRGPGDGVSDSIPAVIGKKQPARLADGEFVVPARIVSELGNGSTEAGARKLYAMMDRVQKARGKTVGKGKVAKNTRADKHLPA